MGSPGGRLSDDKPVQTENVPGNLLGYNIYRDGIFVFYQDHVGSFEEPITQSAIDENLEPGIYDYTVTGVYDLEEFGFPGETGESMAEGPAVVTVDYCFDLEFKETWVQGSFEVNQWEAEGENWKINGQVGDPAPSAEFTWDPVKTGYDLSLESYPMCAAGMTEGRIWLDYTIKLETFHVTGEEKLYTEVWGWDEQEWTTVAEYSNLEGSFAWTDEHLDIGPLAMDKVFRIRFRANGANSLNIIGWFVDNIHIYRTCDGPSNLVASVNFDEGIELDWNPPSAFLPYNMKKATDVGASSDEGRALAGYNIYRSYEGKEYQWVGFTTQTHYVDPKLLTGLYCYKVSALWESATDQCESGFTNEACDIVTGTGEIPGTDAAFQIFPNPANDYINIYSEIQMTRVSIFNSLGILIEDRVVLKNQLRNEYCRICSRGLFDTCGDFKRNFFTNYDYTAVINIILLRKGAFFGLFFFLNGCVFCNITIFDLEFHSALCLLNICDRRVEKQQ